MSTKPNQDIYLIAYNIRSLFNVGALFRCADVFTVKKVYLCGYTGVPPRQEISKVALGAEEWIEWERATRPTWLLKKLKKEGVQIAVLETALHAKSLPKFQPRFPLALVVGNEVGGVSKKILAEADAVIQIPMLGKKESLNVAVAAGIGLYQLRNP